MEEVGARSYNAEQERRKVWVEMRAKVYAEGVNMCCPTTRRMQKRQKTRRTSWVADANMFQRERSAEFVPTSVDGRQGQERDAYVFGREGIEQDTAEVLESEQEEL